MYPPNKLGGITAPLALPHFPKLLGHADAATTLTIYGHVLPDDAQVIAALSQAFTER